MNTPVFNSMTGPVLQVQDSTVQDHIDAWDGSKFADYLNTGVAVAQSKSAVLG